jgi:flagellar biosynthetic protein FliO
MEVLQQMTAVVAVLVLFGVSLWLLRRRGAGLSVARRQGLRRIECLERLPLGPHHTLHLVRAGERELLLAVSPSGCSLLETLPRQEAAR